jgi:hypothetical protein
MARGVNSAELSLIFGHEESLINQATTSILERWRTKIAVAQFIGRERPDKSGNYRCIKMMAD